MATPFAAGTVALMLDADLTLNPDEVKQILQETASQMPGYDEYQVGAGYINAYAAVDKVFNRSRNYGSYTGATDLRAFNAQYTTTDEPEQTVTINYSPQTPGPQPRIQHFPIPRPEGLWNSRCGDHFRMGKRER